MRATSLASFGSTKRRSGHPPLPAISARRSTILPIVDSAGTRRKTVEVILGLVPAGVALAWLPLRDRLPNTDLALVLVVTLAGVGYLAGRVAVLVGAPSAGFLFDLLHTRPYGHLSIANGKDILTTALLVVVGAAMGEVAVRLARYQRVATSEADAFALVTDVAGLVATGGEARLVVEALCEELRDGLTLRACDFRLGPVSGDVPFIARDASLVCLDDAQADWSVVALPVWAQGEIVAYFRLERDPALGGPPKPQLQLAVSLADQAGAALSAASTGSSNPPPPQRRLRLVRG